MTDEQWLAHEVKLRVHDERFRVIEGKLNWIISLVIGGLILPIFLHVMVG